MIFIFFYFGGGSKFAVSLKTVSRRSRFFGFVPFYHLRKDCVKISDLLQKVCGRSLLFYMCNTKPTTAAERYPQAHSKFQTAAPQKNKIKNDCRRTLCGSLGQTVMNTAKSFLNGAVYKSVINIFLE